MCRGQTVGILPVASFHSHTATIVRVSFGHQILPIIEQYLEQFSKIFKNLPEKFNNNQFFLSFFHFVTIFKLKFSNFKSRPDT